MKKNILIYALCGENWKGGVYYIKNLLFQLSVTPLANDKYNFFIYSEDSVVDEFSDQIKEMRIEIVQYNESPESLLSVCTNYNIDVVFPVSGGGFTWVINDICLYWIPDFQEIHLPENFSLKEIERRKSMREYMAIEHRGIMLSSKDAYNDYRAQYPEYTENIFIVHFVSYITPLIEQMTDEFEKKIMKKHEIEYDYIFVANQFWKHKNHIVVLKALNRIVNEKKEEVHVIFTGFMQSYGQKDQYVESLYKYVEEHNLWPYTHFLGLLDRKEQLCIMKNAQLLIQPSKFEGWGCSVEDAKTMGKGMLLSDIEVHKEQQYDKSILFPQDDDEKLSTLIIDNWRKFEKYDMEYGKQYIMEKAYQYSLELQNAIDFMGVRRRKNYLLELDRLRNEKVKQLFGGIVSNKICIYGVGCSTQKMLRSCRRVLSDVQFVYSDSDPEKWGMTYEGGKVYPPSKLLELGIKRIVISSIKYQDEIYQSIKEYEKDMEIIKVYNSDKDKNEPLWL